MTVTDLINELTAEININLIAPNYGLQMSEEIPKSVIESWKNRGLKSPCFHRKRYLKDILNY